LAIQNTFESVLLWQNKLNLICWACSRKTLLCFGYAYQLLSHLYHTYPTVMQILVRQKMTSAHIGRRPSPLTLTAPCWRRRHRCNGCRVVANIATVTIIAATDTAAAISAAFLLQLPPLFG
jgi:hypothetical protein